ncbi:tetratricopeptide repeat protein [Amycolatopsis sp. NPDC004169]|uniref:tetratricopeptide repeat protein n=1 Tax=Amycolatopsis sp. NPDC004169 TaxID=3154453 RepID=UPI0033A81969
MSTSSENEPSENESFVAERSAILEYLAHLQMLAPTPARDAAMRELGALPADGGSGTTDLAQVEAARRRLLEFQAQLETTTLGTLEARGLRQRTTSLEAAVVVSRSEHSLGAPTAPHRRALAILADDLRRLRQQAGVSVRVLAERSGVPKSTIGDYLYGRVIPPREALAKLLQTCGVTEPGDVRQWLRRRDELAEPFELAVRGPQTADHDLPAAVEDPSDRSTGDSAVSSDVPAPASRTTEPQMKPSSMKPVPRAMKPPHADPQATPAVWHVPPDVGEVVGRDGVLDELDAFTTDSAGLPRAEMVVLTGGPGVGKTTVALRCAHRAAGRYPDGVVMLDLRGDGQAAGRTAADVVELLLELLDVQVHQIVSPAVRVARLSQLLVQRRMLVILDNVARTEQVKPLLGVLAGCTVVVVTRHRLPALAAGTSPVVTVGPLSEAAARELLEQRIGAPARQDPAGTSRLIRLCRGNALALTLVAVRAVTRTGIRLTTLAETLRAADTLLDLGSHGDGLDSTLRSAFTVSVQGLGAAEQRTFSMIGLHPGVEVTPEAIAAADGRPVSNVRRSLDVLVAAHLIERVSDLDRYRVHTLLQLYAASLARTLPDFELARRRLLEFYLLTAFEAHQLVRPRRRRPEMSQISDGVVAVRFATPAGARQWFLRERRALTSSVELAERAGFHDIALTLPSLTADVFDQYGYFNDIIRGFTVAASSAAAVGDVYAEASSLNDLGHTLLLMGQESRAEPYLEAALRLADAHGIGIGRVTAMLNMARRHLHAGRITEAVEMSREALVAARELGDPERYAAALHRLADALLGQREHHGEALELYQEALALRERNDDGPGCIRTRIALGDLLTRMERHTEADEQCRKASALVARKHYLPSAAKLNTVLARLRHAEGQDRAALRHAHQAMELADRSRHATSRGRALDTLATILRDRGNVEDARALWLRAAQLFRGREWIGQALRIEGLLAELDAPLDSRAHEGDSRVRESVADIVGTPTSRLSLS